MEQNRLAAGGPAVQDDAGHDGAPDPIALLVAEFESDVVYLNTASLGLPPRRTVDAVRSALDDWRRGISNPVDFDAPLAAARADYGSLVGMPPESIAVGSQVSVFAGLVAANLPDGSEVLTAEGDFTSILFPFHAQARRGVVVREVPLEDIADAVTPATTVVSVSSVQSSNGRMVDLDALEAACAVTGTRVLLDTTQSTGWLPIDAGRFAYTVGGGYKWLLSPRGTAFFTVQDSLLDDLIPHNANWYAGEHPWSSIYGTPLRLAADARRLDVSPAWHSWVGAAPSMAMLQTVGTDRLHRHAVGLSDRFCAAVGIPATGSAIVSLGVADTAVPAILEARISAAMRAGRLRLAFHVSTSEEDVDIAAETLRPHLV
ncbi:aminotransferase class V-fold PLP-dependent enzyme [Planctomonas psychrotolerans]|uniref:aminotransferase class V-fold PLP-dependent enzyme n=1 Tax=Planctomonas psychrotolerans TaxID=2528712 RepID=UPI00123AE350|nr:aminotransferase class V-fold PLP-dependent enzyme [Planctomonas psychrotolerans]